jgi:hypothetical protein
LRYVYLPTLARHTARKAALRHLVDTFFDGSAAGAVSALLGRDAGRLSGDDLDRIEAAVEVRATGGEVMQPAALVLQSSVVLAVALAAAFAFRRRSAALRHFILASGVVAVIAAAALARVTPAWEITVPSVPFDTAAPVGSVPDSTGTPIVRARGRTGGAGAGCSLRSAVGLVVHDRWLGGLAAVTARLLAGLVGLRRWRHAPRRVSTTTAENAA